MNKLIICAMMFTLSSMAMADDSQTGCFNYGPNQCPPGSGPARIPGNFHYGPQMRSLDSATGLSGVYVLTTDDCAGFLNNNNIDSENNGVSPAGFTVGAVIVVKAGAKAFSMAPQGDNAAADRVIYRIGAVSEPSEGGTFTETNQYLSGGNEFSHSAFDQEPGESIVITKPSQGLSINVDGGARFCTLSIAR
jgi:hypothetical protein